VVAKTTAICTGIVHPKRPADLFSAQHVFEGYTKSRPESTFDKRKHHMNAMRVLPNKACSFYPLVFCPFPVLVSRTFWTLFLISLPNPFPPDTESSLFVRLAGIWEKCFLSHTGTEKLQENAIGGARAWRLYALAVKS
jgi:hypothetical protein